MRRQPEFAVAVHVLTADLHLDARILAVDDGGVDRPVSIALGRGDVILELAGHHFKMLVNDAQRPIAILGLFGDDAKGHDIG